MNALVPIATAALSQIQFLGQLDLRQWLVVSAPQSALCWVGSIAVVFVLCACWLRHFAYRPFDFTKSQAGTVFKDISRYTLPKYCHDAILQWFRTHRNSRRGLVFSWSMLSQDSMIATESFASDDIPNTFSGDFACCINYGILPTLYLVTNLAHPVSLSLHWITSSLLKSPALLSGKFVTRVSELHYARLIAGFVDFMRLLHSWYLRRQIFLLLKPARLQPYFSWFKPIFRWYILSNIANV